MIKIHPSADVQTESIGENTTIWQFSIILPKAILGTNCNINSHCFIENDVAIGNNVTIKCGVFLWDGLRLEDDVMIGPNVTFTNDRYPRSKQPFLILKTLVKKGASIGANSTILGGITIGEYALIGAGSVVTKDVPANTLWACNPATNRGYICNCGYKLDSDLYCSNCNSHYELSDSSIKLSPKD